MNKEVLALAKQLENTLSGQPWFGRAVYEILDEVDPNKVYEKPNNGSHSLAELLYHMITWASFTLKRLENEKEKDLQHFEKMDWITIDPSVHTWQKGLDEFKQVNSKIIEILKQRDDAFLKDIVDYREYNFRFLLNGIIQHHIYHLGQIAYVKKYFDSVVE